MLVYSNRSNLRTVFARRGSVCYDGKTLVVGVLLAIVAGMLSYMADSSVEFAPVLPHHYGMHALGAIVGFSVVFRMNFGWQRYWEAVTQLHMMYSKWSDAYSQIFAFASVTLDTAKSKDTDEARQKVARIQVLMEKLSHDFTLLSALAADRLTHGDAQRMEQRSLMVRWDEQIAMRRELHSDDKTHAHCMPEFQLPDEAVGTGPHGVANHWTGTKYPVRGLPSAPELQTLTKSKDRPHVVMYWIVSDFAKISKDIDIAPPIQSRVYQELSNGMLGFNQVQKIADVPFPFPYAQLMLLLLAFYSIFIPIYIVVFTRSSIVSPILTFLLFEGVWGINASATELENPFGPDVNDITVVDFHNRFVQTIEEIIEADAVRSEPSHCSESEPMCDVRLASPPLSSMNGMAHEFPPLNGSRLPRFKEELVAEHDSPLCPAELPREQPMPNWDLK